jgi:hypothetical protein
MRVNYSCALTFFGIVFAFGRVASGLSLPIPQDLSESPPTRNVKAVAPHPTRPKVDEFYDTDGNLILRLHYAADGRTREVEEKFFPAYQWVQVKLLRAPGGLLEACYRYHGRNKYGPQDLRRLDFGCRTYYYDEKGSHGWGAIPLFDEVYRDLLLQLRRLYSNQ